MEHSTNPEILSSTVSAWTNPQLLVQPFLALHISKMEKLIIKHFPGTYVLYIDHNNGSYILTGCRLLPMQ